MVAAYTQVPMGGDSEYYVVLPQIVYQVMDDCQAATFKGLRLPVRRAEHALYGIQRSGTDFIKTLGGWLQCLGWVRVPEEPELFVYWANEGDGTQMRGAGHFRSKLTGSFKLGNNPILMGEFQVPVANDSVENAKRGLSSSRCALMGT